MDCFLLSHSGVPQVEGLQRCHRFSLIGGLLTTGLIIVYVWLVKDREHRTTRFLAEQIEVKHILEEEIGERKLAEEGLRIARDELEEPRR